MYLHKGIILGVCILLVTFILLSMVDSRIVAVAVVIVVVVDVVQASAKQQNGCETRRPYTKPHNYFMIYLDSYVTFDATYVKPSTHLHFDVVCL